MIPLATFPSFWLPATLFTFQLSKVEMSVTFVSFIIVQDGDRNLKILNTKPRPVPVIKEQRA